MDIAKYRSLVQGMVDYLHDNDEDSDKMNKYWNRLGYHANLVAEYVVDASEKFSQHRYTYEICDSDTNEVMFHIAQDSYWGRFSTETEWIFVTPVNVILYEPVGEAFEPSDDND